MLFFQFIKTYNYFKLEMFIYIYTQALFKNE